MRALLPVLLCAFMAGPVCPAWAQEPVPESQPQPRGQEPAQPQEPEQPAQPEEPGGLTSQRPWQGLFGGSTPQSTRMDRHSEQLLDLSGSLSAGFDDDMSGIELPPDVQNRYRL